MIKKYTFLLFCLISFSIQAQYTELINSNRPGFSESPYSVGTNVYQFEGNFFFREADATPTFSNPGAYGLNFAFRTSFFLERLEFSLNSSVQNDKIAFKNVFESSYREFGFSQLTLGAKYLVFEPTYTDKAKEVRSWKKRHAFDWKRLYPSVAVYTGANFGSVLNNIHERGGLTPKVGILLQNEFSNRFNLITNIYYDYIGSNYSQWSYIVTGTYNITPRWSGFIEHQALFDNQESKSNLGAGAAFLFTPNLQINGSLRATFNENATGIYGSIGISYRIDNHQDNYKEYDENGNLISGGENTTYGKKKGFFSRIFGWINFLKKKENREQKVDLDIESEEEKTNTPRKKPKRKRKKSATKKGFFGKIFGNNPEKEVAKAKKKTARKIAKEKRKEEKRKAKEAKRLEKEIKKLEKELKEEEKKEEEENNKKNNND